MVTLRSPVKWALLGDNDLGSNKGAADPQVREIIQRILHPNYKPPSMYNDIGLYRLSKPVQFNRFIFPTCINTEVQLTTKQAIAIGWGRTSSGFYIFFENIKILLCKIFKIIFNLLIPSCISYYIIIMQLKTQKYINYKQCVKLDYIGTPTHTYVIEVHLNKNVN